MSLERILKGMLDPESAARIQLAMDRNTVILNELPKEALVTLCATFWYQMARLQQSLPAPFDVAPELALDLAGGVIKSHLTEARFYELFPQDKPN